MENETNNQPSTLDQTTKTGLSLVHKTFLLSAIGVSAICLTLLVVADWSADVAPPSTANRIDPTQPQPRSQNDVNPYSNIALEAKAVHVYDVNTGETLFAKNADQTLPLASITKVMTALASADILPANSAVAISDESLREEGDSGLRVGVSWQLGRLRDLMLVASSNDGAHALASAAGAFLTSQPENSRTDLIGVMNQKADMLGLTSMQFSNETGLDISESEAGAYGSAHDVNQLIKYVLKNNPELLEATAKPIIVAQPEDSTALTVVNTNPIVGAIPGLLASKTGFSDLAGGNLVVAFDAGLQRPIIITVLGSSYEGRFIDMQRLVAATYEALSTR